MSDKSSAAAAALAKANQRNAELRGTNADLSYVREWDRFKEWVDNKRMCGILPAKKNYLCRDSVDLYSSEVIANLTCKPKVAKQIRPALQFYANEIEYVGSTEKFIVESEEMEKTFRTQATSHARDQLLLKTTLMPIFRSTSSLHKSIKKHYH